MDALTRLHLSLVGGDDDEKKPEDSILADTEGLCSLSPLQVKQTPSIAPECSTNFLTPVCIDLIHPSQFAWLSGSTPSRHAWWPDSP
uniref:Uncharacterized protein n=1 Tax=Arundo donax TaxID=35708 RepID=A0A0A9GU65_ARUDO